MTTIPSGKSGTDTGSTDSDTCQHLTFTDYSTAEAFEYAYDAVGNRSALTSTTPLSGTVVTTYTYDTANRLTDRAVSDGRTYTYDWSDRGQLLTEWTQGYPVRTFTYDGAGQMVAATLFTQTTRFRYNGLGTRVAVEVVDYGVTTVTLDLAAGNRSLAEETLTGTTLYLYPATAPFDYAQDKLRAGGYDCLGELCDDLLLRSAGRRRGGRVPTAVTHLNCINPPPGTGAWSFWE